MTAKMRLYDTNKQRLYINAEEREMFLQAATKVERQARTLAMTLVYTGCRISEAIELNMASIQLEARIVTFRSLKKRSETVMREVPVPPALVDALDLVHGIRSAQKDIAKARQMPLWTYQGGRITRNTAYRWIKDVMDVAGIGGAHASPKGLRHGYGIHATRSGVQLHMLQKWMGHTDMTTTAIYANAIGQDEMDIADRMW